MASQISTSGCCNNVDTICCKGGERQQFKIDTRNGSNLDACGLDSGGNYWGFRHYNDITCGGSDMVNNPFRNSKKRCLTLDSPPPGTDRAAFQTSSIWKKERSEETGNMIIRVGFKEPSEVWKKKWVEKVVKEKIESLVKIEFVFVGVDSPNSMEVISNEAGVDILIGFERGYANSAVGNESLQLARFGNQSMNLGWLDNPIEFTGIDGVEYRVPPESLGEYLEFAGNFTDGGVVVHEFGHALGMIHEHQSPTSNLKFNKPELYDYLASAPNCWDKEIVDYNVIDNYSDSSQLYNYSSFDKKSIMIYPMFGWWTESCKDIPFSGVLSKKDKIWLQRIYKPREGTEIFFCDSPEPVCGEGGVCVEENVSCVCSSPYSGEYCEINADPACDGVECEGGGVCIFGTCNCPPGRSGDRCEIVDDICENVDCKNGSTCVLSPENGSPMCECKDESFSGPFCDIPMGVVNKCENTMCPGGDCDAETGDCICSAGFSGPLCETTSCDKILCEGGGYCSVIPETGEAECICPVGRDGDRCQDKVDSECEGVYCANGVCGKDGNCRCFQGWTGPLCDIEGETNEVLIETVDNEGGGGGVVDILYWLAIFFIVIFIALGVYVILKKIKNRNITIND